MKIGIGLAVTSALFLSACTTNDALRIARGAAVGAINGAKAEIGLTINRAPEDQLAKVAALCVSGTSIVTVWRFDVPSLDAEGSEFCAAVLEEQARRVALDSAL